MIEWIKVSEMNPNDKTDYLITDGKEVEVGTWYSEQWFSHQDMGLNHSDVTHYAKINLPEFES